jgi:hypothetical protein
MNALRYYWNVEHNGILRPSLSIYKRCGITIGKCDPLTKPTATAPMTRVRHRSKPSRETAKPFFFSSKAEIVKESFGFHSVRPSAFSLGRTLNIETLLVE